MDISILLGRILLGGMFIMFGMNHFLQFPGMVGYAQAKGLPLARTGVLLGGIFQLLGGSSLLLGLEVEIGAWLLVAFLVPNTFYVHRFWTVADFSTRTVETVIFFKNLGLLGGILLVATMPQPWPYSLG